MKRILIVEDDTAISNALTAILKEENYSVEHEIDGQEAMVRIEAEDFNLVLLDILIPSMNGKKIMKKIHDDKLDQKVIVLSNLDEQQDRQNILDWGALEYVVKASTSIDEIKELVNKYS